MEIPIDVSLCEQYREVFGHSERHVSVGILEEENHVEVRMQNPRSPRVRAIAYYRTSVRDGQQNSIAIQRDQVRLRALEHGVEIIREFCDLGPSAIEVDKRPAFVEMLEDWVQRRPDFDYILCLEPSRWRRFSGGDLSARSREICEGHNEQVIYSSVGMRSLALPPLR